MFRRWVSVEPAADFADFDAVRLFSVLLAADAAFLLVSLVVLLWVSAEPAADFADFDADGLFKVLLAADAAFLPVFSVFFAMLYPNEC